MTVYVNDLRDTLYVYLLGCEKYSHISDYLKDIADEATQEIVEMSKRYPDVSYSKWVKRGKELVIGMAEKKLKELKRDTYIEVGSRGSVLLRNGSSNIVVKVSKEEIECLEKRRNANAFYHAIKKLSMKGNGRYIISVLLTLTISPKVDQKEALKDVTRIIGRVKGRVKRRGFSPLGHMRVLELNDAGTCFHVHIAFFHKPVTKEAIESIEKYDSNLRFLYYAHRVDENVYKYKKMWKWGRSNVSFKVIVLPASNKHKGGTDGNGREKRDAGSDGQELEGVSCRTREAYRYFGKGTRYGDVGDIKAVTKYITKSVTKPDGLIQARAMIKELGCRFRLVSSFFQRDEDVVSVYKFHRLPKYVQRFLLNRGIEPDEVKDVCREYNRYLIITKDGNEYCCPKMYLAYKSVSRSFLARENFLVTKLERDKVEEGLSVEFCEERSCVHLGQSC